MIRLASYNIHSAIGRDRRYSPRRIRDVLLEIDADVYALQEVESDAAGLDFLQWLAAQTGMKAVAGPTILREYGHYGNALLARCPISEVGFVDLTWSRREPRGAIAADLACEGACLRVVATHLGLRPAERRELIRKLLRLFNDNPRERSVLAGDLNEWFLWGRPLRRLRAHFAPSPSLKTFPSGMPFFALDRIYATPAWMVKDLRVHATDLARQASDHLPLVATLQIHQEAAEVPRPQSRLAA
jgi:endonuclease/exonuclease/phosphatase family metal-dependent hydrolase